MTTIKRARRVPYKAEQLYDLVNDVPAYPQFVPACHESAVVSDNGTEVVARLSFSKGGLEKSFTTTNTLTPSSRIDIKLHDGPFSKLEGHWLFKEEGDKACLVLLELEFEFSSSLVELFFGPIFNQVANKLVDTFCDRAAAVYGRS